MKTKLTVKGMTCNHCVKHVKEALEAIPEVSGADVDLKAGTATVTHKESITLEKLKEAVSEAGYEAV